MSAGGGTNDVVILMSLLLTLTLVGFLAPLIQTELRVCPSTGCVYNSPTYYNASDPFVNASEYGEATNPTNTGNLNMVQSIFISFFWVYDWFPIWLTLIHVVIRLIGIVLIYRLARSGGG